ncbi:KOW motif-containing protein [Noviherbaspirillum sp. Root189]|uniref:KOW motif-containing protein n=1 Tax=Noviherbaspirillum sp. Root189 TaxID=1736487 RepID=UPI00070FA36D|nr:KOW motif-containing protein [Noviherbaspirillum sp. Root189]KRB70488.1 hypothetical protein ASE07_07700 [Noviherbaspirillum sp. Root189]
MKKGDEARIHDVVRVNVGKYAGLAGTVEAIDGDKITVAISGVQNGEHVEVRQEFNEKALGRLKHG